MTPRLQSSEHIEYKNRMRHLRTAGSIFAVLIISFFFLAIAIYRDTNCLEINYHVIEHQRLGDVLGHAKICFITDLHVRSPGWKENVILEILRQEKPDLILLGGDYVDSRGDYGQALRLIGRFEAPLGVFAVMGNAEYHSENGSCILCHRTGSKTLEENKSPIFLRNRAVRLVRNGKVVNLIGLDDPVTRRDKGVPDHDLEEIIPFLNGDHPNILIVHSPEIYAEAVKHGIDFVLCGHNHGGQIFFAKYLRSILHLDPSLEYAAGFFRERKTLMYVSKGVGTSILPFRLGVRPEITFFTFTKKEKRNRPEGSDRVLYSKTKTYYAEVSCKLLRETFSILPVLIEKDLLPTVADEQALFDFENEKDLMHLNRECHKWFERSRMYSTSGSYSLKVELPPGKYPGIEFREFCPDWSQSTHFKIDIYNPGSRQLKMYVRFDDRKGRCKIMMHHDHELHILPGMNYVSIALKDLKSNVTGQFLDLRRMHQFKIYVPDNPRRTEFYMDHVRLERQ